MPERGFTRLTRLTRNSGTRYIVADKCRNGELPARPVLPGTLELGARELVRLFVLGKNHDDIY